MRYEEALDIGPPVVVLDTPRELLAFRRVIDRTLTACGIPSRDRPDLVQIVLVVTLAALEHRRVRGSHPHDAETALRMFVRNVARKTAANHRNCFRNSREILSLHRQALDELEAPPFLPRLEARDELRRLFRHRPGPVRVLLLHALGYSTREAGRKLGIKPKTYHARLMQARRSLAMLLPSGLVRDPNPQQKRRK